MSAEHLLRADLVWIANKIAPAEVVLDLGCGDGALLAKLRDEKDCTVHGIEIDQRVAVEAVAKGISVSCIDLDDGLSMFEDDTFDTVILSQTLMMVRQPEVLLEEMLRVGKRVVVSYPNFANWRVRSYLMFRGRMPVSKSIPYTWYETPNIHHTTIKDFEDLVDELGGAIEAQIVLTRKSNEVMKPVGFWPNLMGDTVVASICHKPAGAKAST